ncbi:hypothetical protein CWB89_05710 [Pseudoalteromonas piscicida]|uniref:Carboxypeptidase regulatory-like domain-containing protein n=1 Tax=Pseudoalteromonas piscicida TaxID=43662 RepID=A0AAQ2ITE5_PSEO7|nr:MULTISPECIES: hypothetical protein [Pseudoalteromonas]KJY90479.1 hypothetical protein TW75_07550 [Pseudoalteromonas piscicida]MDP4488996.1 hypothetical protein [Pseudoalteromonas piscicida]TMN43923.1 hypothetical protein CWB95_04375 [Pseudoalteromonas piscicida]TMN44176.1 hypothetical protein CWB94_02165 [Pseudoalteromonas piscicida]TMN49688.1 hypothetical protein CWB92_14795 [Pseudoalteromonas piscicida]
MISNKKSLLALSVASALALSGCFSDDDNNVVITPPPEPTDPVVVAPETPTALAFVVSGNVVDVDTVDIVAPATITFFEDGEPTSNLVNVNGDAITQITTEDGSYTFTVKEGANVGVVTAVVAADGYFSKSFDIDLSNEDSAATLEAELALVSKGGDEVVEASVSESVANATTASPVTAAAAKGKAGSDVTVPAGVQLRDASGNAVTGTSVSLTVGSADPTSSKISAVLPAGLSAGSTTSIKKPVGVSNIVMQDNNGTKIKQFSQEIDVSVSLPVATLAPSGDRTIQTGDQFDVSSNNEDTGKWQSETNKATVGALNAEGTAYKASFKTDHLTFFTLSRSVPICTQGITVNVTGDTVPSSGLYVSMTSADASVSSYLRGGTTSKTVVSASTSARYGISSSATARVVIRDAAGNVWGNASSTNAEVQVCNGPVSITLANPIQTTVNENVTVRAVCSNDTTVTEVIPGAIVKYRSSTTKPFRTAANNGDGTFALSALNGDVASYAVSVDPRISAPFTTSITPDGTDETIDVSVACDTVTGS